MSQMSNEWMEKVTSIIINGMNNSFLLSHLIWKNSRPQGFVHSDGGWVKLSVYFSRRMKSLRFGEIMHSHSVIHSVYTLNINEAVVFFHSLLDKVQYKHCIYRMINVLLKMSSKSYSTTKNPGCCMQTVLMLRSEEQNFWLLGKRTKCTLVLQRRAWVLKDAIYEKQIIFGWNND